MIYIRKLLLKLSKFLSFKKKVIYFLSLLLFHSPFEVKADVDLMIRGGFLSGLWTIDLNSNAFNSTRRGNSAGSTAAVSSSFEMDFFSFGYEFEKSFQERWYYGDASESNDDDNWSSISTEKVKHIIFLGLGTTGQNMFSFLSTRIGYIHKAKLDLGKNILATNPKATYEGQGIKLSFFYKNIFQTLDWGLDFSLDLNYISYNYLSTNGASSTIPGTINGTYFSVLEELSASFTVGISFTFLKNIFEYERGKSFFRMPGDD